MNPRLQQRHEENRERLKKRTRETGAAARTASMGLEGVPLLPQPAAVFWLIKVSGLYLTRTRGLAGDPAAGEPFVSLARAREVRDEVREKRIYLGKIRIVRRRHLRAPLW